ncbi:hypothetical protein Ahy_B01g052986 [Arachis hypogaea]|uniref:SWIM-type domain-containing protein n=1 Tax=Arachis hypogaea TaxID=3818 RepID=A0A445AQS9_ARAHY|nr:hypothetical protein Ahy_B01g052986 [Arachis hypogaea]
MDAMQERNPFSNTGEDDYMLDWGRFVRWEARTRALLPQCLRITDGTEFRRCTLPTVIDRRPFFSWRSWSHSRGSFRVCLTVGTCDCSLFQSLHFPCRHALAACAAASVEWGSYVHPVYLQEEVYKVYEKEFPLIPDERLWPEWFGVLVRPNPAMCQIVSGKSVSTRFRNKMDEGEHQEKRCDLCRKTGHTQRDCPN